MSKELLKIASAFEFLCKTASLKKFVLPKGTKIYHGTIARNVPAIEESGMLQSLWEYDDQTGKVSAGSPDEAGLIWFTPDVEVAAGFGMGQEAHFIEGKKPGRVYVVETDRDLVFAERWDKLGPEEAEILAKINRRQHYDAIEEGTSLRSAVNKISAWDRDKKIWRHVLPLLGLDGVYYDTPNHPHQYGIVAKELPVSYSMPAEPIWNKYVERVHEEAKIEEEKRRKEEEIKAKRRAEQEEENRRKREAMTPEEQEQRRVSERELLELMGLL